MTGGDDNALAFTRFSPWSQSAPTSQFTVHTSTLILSRAHTAAVRAIAIKGRRVINHIVELDIVTASNDQRLKTWHVRIDASETGVDGLQVVKGQNMYTAVADIAGVDVIGDADNSEGRRDERNESELGGGEEQEMRESEVGGGEEQEMRGTQHWRAEEERRVRVVVCGVGMDVKD